MTPPISYSNTQSRSATEVTPGELLSAANETSTSRQTSEILESTAWRPTASPFSTEPAVMEFAAGDPFTATQTAAAQRDPVRIAAVWISVLVVATAAWSLIWGSTL